MIAIDRAIRDPALLGAALGGYATSWSTWSATLKAAFGLPLSDSELTTFRGVAGDRLPPTKRVRELWAVVGRRGGKSKMSAAIAVYLACFVKHNLSPGETGYVLVLAMSRDQAQVVCDYALAFLQDSAVLRQEITSVTTTEIRLRNGIVISTHANSFRSVRGRTLVAAVLDETAFWRDETSAAPDIEVYRAIRPSLATTNGMIIGISTPYRRTGLLHTKYRDHFGVDGDDVLVVQGPSIKFNPRLTPERIAEEMRDDPEGNAAEWQAEFRSDLSAFLADELIEDAIQHARPLELPPRRGQFGYKAFVDPSGGRHDHFAMCIGHQEGPNRYVADVIRGTSPPFDPQSVVKDYTGLLKQYGIGNVVGDNYSAEWAVSAFAGNGISYVRSDVASRNCIWRLYHCLRVAAWRSPTIKGWSANCVRWNGRPIAAGETQSIIRAGAATTMPIVWLACLTLCTTYATTSR